MQKSVQKIQTKRCKKKSLQKIIAKTDSSARSAVSNDVSRWLAKQENKASAVCGKSAESVCKDTEARIQKHSRAEQAVEMDTNRVPKIKLGNKYKATSEIRGEKKDVNIQSPVQGRNDRKGRKVIENPALVARGDTGKEGSMARGGGNQGCRPP